jgi:phosphoribosyl-ATP pyrophosphohydrolase
VDGKMTNYLGKLLEFHRKYGHYEFYGYQVPKEDVDLRIRLIQEEVNDEMLPILYKLRDFDGRPDEWWNLMVELADGLGDSLYVIFGTCITMGIPMDQVFTEIHRSNMSKSTEKNEFGKTIKGPDWSPPNLMDIIVNPQLLTESEVSLSKNEASHLMNILLDYIKRDDYLEETIHIVDETKTTTADLISKIGLHVTK